MLDATAHGGRPRLLSSQPAREYLLTRPICTQRSASALRVTFFRNTTPASRTRTGGGTAEHWAAAPEILDPCRALPHCDHPAALLELAVHRPIQRITTPAGQFWSRRCVSRCSRQLALRGKGNLSAWLHGRAAVAATASRQRWLSDEPRLAHRSRAGSLQGCARGWEILRWRRRPNDLTSTSARPPAAAEEEPHLYGLRGATHSVLTTGHAATFDRRPRPHRRG